MFVWQPEMSETVQWQMLVNSIVSCIKALWAAALHICLNRTNTGM